MKIHSISCVVLYQSCYIGSMSEDETMNITISGRKPGDAGEQLDMSISSHVFGVLCLKGLVLT